MREAIFDTNKETRRAYTARIKGPDRDDESWREKLWLTHEAVNNGTKVFGDWLLTFRGGLCQSLVNSPIIEGRGKKKIERRPKRDELRDRRVLLALSWLSVESEGGAPHKYLIRHDLDCESGLRSNWQTEKALRVILTARGLPDNEIEEWLSDCGASLSANIRKDAVWVNRSACFDEASQKLGGSLDREKIWDLLDFFFKDRLTYLKPISVAEAVVPDDSGPGKPTTEEPKELRNEAGQWLSARFGTGSGADFSEIARACTAIAEWARSARSATTLCQNSGCNFCQLHGVCCVAIIC